MSRSRAPNDEDRLFDEDSLDQWTLRSDPYAVFEERPPAELEEAVSRIHATRRSRPLSAEVIDRAEIWEFLSWHEDSDRALEVESDGRPRDPLPLSSPWEHTEWNPVVVDAGLEIETLHPLTGPVAPWSAVGYPADLVLEFPAVDDGPSWDSLGSGTASDDPGVLPPSPGKDLDGDHAQAAEAPAVTDSSAGTDPVTSAEAPAVPAETLATAAGIPAETPAVLAEPPAPADHIDSGLPAENPAVTAAAEGTDSGIPAEPPAPADHIDSGLPSEPPAPADHIDSGLPAEPPAVTARAEGTDSGIPAAAPSRTQADAPAYSFASHDLPADSATAGPGESVHSHFDPPPPTETSAPGTGVDTRGAAGLPEGLAGELESASSANEISTALLQYCAMRFGRAFVLVESGGHASVWKGVGEGTDDPELGDLRVPLDLPSALKAAAGASGPIHLEAPEGPVDEQLFAQLSPRSPYLVIAAVSCQGAPVAFVYAESALEPLSPEAEQELQTVVELAGRAHARLRSVSA